MKVLRIAVFGAGAIGNLFGGLLAEAGKDVVFVTRKRSQAYILNRDGLRITGLSGDRVVRVKATSDAYREQDIDLIILSVKSYDTVDALAGASRMASEKTALLTLQNGLGNVEKTLKTFGRDRTLGGTTTMGSTLVRPNEICHTGWGETVLGEASERLTERVSRIAQELNEAGIKTQVTSNLSGWIWSKVVVNVGINALAAITGLRNGELLEYPWLRNLMAKAVYEAVEVAEALNVKLEIRDPLQRVEEVAWTTSKNKASMLQDLERGKKTEIDYLNGAVLKLGKELNIQTPVNEVLTGLVKAIEAQRTVKERKMREEILIERTLF